MTLGLSLTRFKLTMPFRIVGEDEADPRAGSIAYVSPLARLLIGKRVGEAVEMDVHEIEIVAIE